MKKGYIQIYTGNGKGKTTASVGQAIRALGAGLKVCFVQFFKEKERSSEFKILKALDNFTYYNFCPQYPYWIKNKASAIPLNNKVKKECNLALEFIKEVLLSNEYDMVVIDEIDIALRDGYIDTKDLLAVLGKNRGNKEVILTGRGAPKTLIEHADLVTEMKEIKHYFKKNVKARKGIEY